MTTKQTLTRTAYNRYSSRLLRQKMHAAERFVELSPAETPRALRAPYAASEWLKLSPEGRRDHIRARVKEEIVAMIGPRPKRAGKQPLTLSALEDLTIERADNHASDLRFILNGTPDQVEAIVAAQLPALRARVFDELVSTFQIVEG